MSLTHVPLKNTGFWVSPCTRKDTRYLRTADTMLLHGGNFLKREAGCIYHEGEFRYIDLHELITFYGNDKKDEKNQIAGPSQS